MPGSTITRLELTADLGMAITSSVLADVSLQRDGRRWVREHHIDHIGVLIVRSYLADASEDLEAALAVYAQQLLVNLRDEEINRNIGNVLANGRLANTLTIYSTPAENFAALREAYRSATRTEAIMAGDFLASLTDAQLRTAFNMTAAQVTQIRTDRLSPATNAANTIRATTGA